MKIAIGICIVITLLFFSGTSANNEKTGANLKTNNEIKNDILGGSTNFSTRKNSAITYGLADVAAYSVPLTEINKLKSPTFIPKLPEKFDIPRSGPLENVEEVPSSTDYYDGSINLNKKKILCKIHGNATECLKNSSCGWCGSSGVCILGNNLGPLQSCLRSTFVYSSPVPNWNLSGSVINSDSNGVKFVLKDKNTSG
mmetsp:Transcript_9994/g.10305  ORF Transcript_9994/g.10305 Transcript_9994/m.10305 type:complete len:198 (-) Transcript_9994:71-664(-)